MRKTGKNNQKSPEQQVGVRQGGVASPKLFSIYIAPLIQEISKCKEGFELGQLKMDIQLYADDILLISETKIGLRRQLEIVEKYGHEFDVKFNPDKTVYMVFNEKCERSAEAKRKDIWQGRLALCDSELEKTDCMKYLGFEIDKENNDKKHIQKRKQKTIGCLSKLKMFGINSDLMCPYMKGQLFKIYIRPILLYGIENVKISKSMANEIKRFDGNILKKLFNISKRCKTTPLQLALDITPIVDAVKILKLDFYNRLFNNDYTKSVLFESSSLPDDDDFLSEIIQLTDEQLCTNEGTLNERVNWAKNEINVKFKYNKASDPQTKEVTTVLRMKNRTIIPSKLFEILKF